MRVNTIGMLPFALALVVGAAASAQEAERPAQPALTLGIGDPAPAFEPEHWIQGKPIGGFETGKTYVIEFWATWCGPCIAAMPHLTELQKKHPEVAFVGLAASERRPKEGEDDERLPYVRGFVRGKGDLMGYRVAYTPERDISNRWMAAAGQSGIPCSFIVGPSGVIEWIGHPMQMDGPLEKILAGEWDRSAEAERSKTARQARERASAFSRALAKAQADADWDAVIGLYRDRIKEEPENEMLAISLYEVLAGRAGRPNDASALGRDLLVRFKDEPEALNRIAWFTVDDRSVKQRDLALALEAAERATELTKGQNAAILDTLARVWWEKGDKSKALELQKKAVNTLASDDNTPMAREMKQTLERYQSESR